MDEKLSIRCKIDGISHNGEGVARIEGKTFFIPQAIPGETVAVNVTENRKSYSRATIETIIESSPDRTEPLCPQYSRCGGCAYQHVGYSRQLEFKRQVTEQTLKRIGKITTPVAPVLAMDNPFRYRNKVSWRYIPRQGLGFCESGSHRLISGLDCLIVPKPMLAVGRKVWEVISPAISYPLEVQVRQSFSHPNIMITLLNLKAQDQLQVLPLKSVCASFYTVYEGQPQHLGGDFYLLEEINTLKYYISSQAFFQVNSWQAGRMAGLVMEYLDLKGNEEILDLYCGSGFLSLSAARMARRVTGVESFSAAIADARYNAAVNGIDNCRFIQGECEKVLPGLTARFDAVVLDPPRSGCRPEVIKAVAALQPSKIIYVSCEPSTLARDLALFAQSGYMTAQVQPIDMFPQTRHIENIVLLQRRDT